MMLLSHAMLARASLDDEKIHIDIYMYTRYAARFSSVLEAANVRHLSDFSCAFPGKVKMLGLRDRKCGKKYFR